MNRLFTAIILFFVACAAFADPTGSISTAKQFASTLTPPETDYSVAYLSQIFGTVGNVLAGTSGQILGKMFDIFNKGVLVVAALWLGYTTIRIAIQAAMEGSFMGANKNVPWLLLRIALGFALIIPSSTTGYSLLQDVFMKIVVAGVGLADQTWDAALHYIEYGGQIYIPPKDAANDKDIIPNMLMSNGGPTSPTKTYSEPLAPAAQIFMNEVCMYASQSWQKQVDKQKGASSADYVAPFRPIFNPTTGMVYFPGVGNENQSETTIESNPACGSAQSYYYANQSASNAEINEGTKDGYWSHSTVTGASYGNNQAQAMADYSYSALKQLVLSEEPAAKNWVHDHQSSSGKSSPETQNENAKSVFTAMLAYVNLIEPYQRLLSTDEDLSGTIIQNGSVENRVFSAVSIGLPGQAPLYYASSSQVTAVANATNKTNAEMGVEALMTDVSMARDEGWISAGGFYWDMETLNDKAANMSVSNLLPKVTIPSIYPSHPATFYSVSHEVVYLYGTTAANLWKTYFGAQANTLSSSIETAGEGSGGGITNTIPEHALRHFVKLANTFAEFGQFNPIILLMRVGKGILVMVVEIWLGAMAITLALAGAAGICSSTSPGSLMLSTALSWIKSIMMLMCTMLLLPGAILSYYLPLYPYAVFTFAAVGWLIMVVEGMAAAPLVCMGLTHPEGHDFLGKAEQALMLFLGIFLRPALMIIGLVAAMLVSYAGTKIVMMGFANLLAGLAGGSGTAIHSTLLALLTNVFLLVALGVIVMEVIEQSYKVVYQLPNAILQWIGGPQTGQDFGQMAQGVKSSVTSTAGSIKEGVQGLDQANTQAVKGIGKGRAAMDKENEGGKNSGDIEGGG